MHLSDLFDDNISFEPKPAKVTPRDTKDLATKVFGPDSLVPPPQNKAGIEKLGRGVLAYAVAKKDKPHEVKRITYAVNKLEGDPYIEFLKAILKIKDSPYVPKIYSVKIFKKAPDAHGSSEYANPYMMYVELERLASWRVLNWAQISYLYNRYLGTSVREVSKNRQSDEYAQPITDKHSAMTIFVSGLEGAMVGRTENTALNPVVNDEELSAVARYLGDVVNRASKSSGIYLDMHKGNIMYRVTPTGVIPVFTDPFHNY